MPGPHGRQHLRGLGIAHGRQRRECIWIVLLTRKHHVGRAGREFRARLEQPRIVALDGLQHANQRR